jgi:hypothetical protein
VTVPAAKAFLRSVLPPVVLSSVRRAGRRIRGQKPTWEYVPEGWARRELDPRVGWDVATVGDRHRAIWDRWLRVVSGTGALGVDFWMYLANAEPGAKFS